jgi:hypothetical protein
VLILDSFLVVAGRGVWGEPVDSVDNCDNPLSINRRLTREGGPDEDL